MENSTTVTYKKDNLLVLMANSKTIKDKFICVEGDSVGKVASWDDEDDGVLKANGRCVDFYFSYQEGRKPDQWILIEGEKDE